MSDEGRRVAEIREAMESYRPDVDKGIASGLEVGYVEDVSYLLGLLDRLEGEPVAWLVECQFGDGEWEPESFRLDRTRACERVKRLNEHDRVQARLVPLYRLHPDQGEGG